MRFMEAIKVKVWLREQGYERVRIKDLGLDGRDGYAVEAWRPDGPVVSIQDYFPAVYGSAGRDGVAGDAESIQTAVDAGYFVGRPRLPIDDACRFCHGHGCQYCGADSGEWRGF